ncbi:MAG: DUF2339 domain-containing protein [Syntrophales bacterium]
MTDKLSSLEARVEQIAAQVDALTRSVEALSVRMDGLDTKPVRNEERPQADDLPDPSEELLSWVGRSSLLQRLSTLCFLLVVALILRTVTENEIIDLHVGSLIGMSYAAALIFMGWRRYRRANPLAPIFTVCGTVLMFTIIVEAHAHFAAIPSVPAYILLMLTGLSTAVISYLYRVPAPIAAGNLGMCLAGAAIDYPTPFFPYLAIVLLTANVLGSLAARADRYAWLRWILLLVTLFMIHLWGFKLGMALLGGETPPPELAFSWFLPVLTLFTATYMATAFLGILRRLPGRISRFELALPTINVAWAFFLAQYVVSAMGDSKMLLGAIGVAASAGHLAVAVWLSGRDRNEARGTNAFVMAGVVLLAAALPMATGSIFVSLPLLAAVAFGTAVVSAKWHSGSVRVTSYLLQIYPAVAMAVILLTRGAIAASFSASVASAGALACIAFVHYRWCRRRNPPEESAFFQKIDKGDFSAVAILLAALLNAFFMLRLIVSRVLAALLVPADLSNALSCIQSAIINLSAIALMFFAQVRRAREVRNVAILVTVIGAVNVFLYDLIRGHGMPLVISVLSFGLATAVESVILGRWQSPSPPLQESSR